MYLASRQGRANDASLKSRRGYDGAKKVGKEVDGRRRKAVRYVLMSSPMWERRAAHDTDRRAWMKHDEASNDRMLTQVETSTRRHFPAA